MSIREDSKQLRREAIVKAARALLRESGGLGFSMRSLAEASGVSIATPYNLFGSKQAILVSVLDADLAAYQTALDGLQAAPGVDVLFEAIDLMGDFLAQEPEFYRNALACVSEDGGTELQFMVSGPRFLLWKRMLRAAIDEGLISNDVDPDALTIALGQLLFAGTYQWSQGLVSLPEMIARARFGTGALLLGITTEQGRPVLRGYFLDAQQRLQSIWRQVLTERLREGTLDERAQILLADQLEHLEAGADERQGSENTDMHTDERKTA